MTEGIDTTPVLLQAKVFQKMFIGASCFFEQEKEHINSLNVFPVPDGDTGTNMSMTLAAAAEAALNYKGNSAGELAEAVAHSSLMGARGNSGVILAQLLRGIARGLANKEQVSLSELSKAFQYGVVYAYKAVSKPVEGTILTVAREIARGTKNAIRSGKDLYGVLEEAIASGNNALKKTTEMLPVLKEAGVVDAGGKGLVVFLNGCLHSARLSMEEIMVRRKADNGTEEAKQAFPGAITRQEEAPLKLLYPYCTELIIKSKENNFASLEAKLLPLGDSQVIVADKNICKVHIHTDRPGLILDICLNYGTLHDIKIDNMYDQHIETIGQQAEREKVITLPKDSGSLKPKEICIISVSFGEGFKEIFFSLGADEIVFGGQTMNPKVEDMVAAVQQTMSEKVIILPNNKNIQLVAEQARKFTSKDVKVLPTKTLPEGLAALFAFHPDKDLESNLKNMEESISRTKSGEVTFATRDTSLQGKKIKKGDYLGIFNGDILVWGESLQDTTLKLVQGMVGDDDEIISIFYGKDISREEAGKLAEALEQNFPEMEMELKYGGQPLYYYILLVE